MIKYAILVGGIVFYFFAITSLLDNISNLSLLIGKGIKTSPDHSSDLWMVIMMELLPKRKSMPSNHVLNTMAKKSKRNSKILAEKLILTTSAKLSHPNKVNLNIITVLDAIEPCIGNVEELAKDTHIKGLTKEEVTTEFLEVFDIDNDDNIRFSEYQIANQFLKKTPKNIRQIFKYFDKNHDWVISKKELEKSKPKNLHIFLVSGKRK